MIENKPVILKAIEMIIAKPENIKAETESLITKYTQKHKNKSKSELQKIIAKKIISNYSYYAGFSGGSTALTSVIPGIGTVLAVFGGASVDTAVCMKYQIEMTMSLAVVYGHNILIEEEKRLCMIIAGLGAISEVGKKGTSNLGSQAFVRLVKEHLKGSLLVTVKEIFKRVGITFTRKALEKSIPFGVSVVVGFGANKLLSQYIGSKAIDFFESE